MPDEPEDVELEESPVETGVRQAQHMHNLLDQIKEMSVQAAIELETMAEYADESDTIENEARELQEAAAMLRTVYNRVEVGDSNLAKQVKDSRGNGPE